MSFPYTGILTRAYHQTVANFHVWVFGIFVSFASSFVFLLLAALADLPDLPQPAKDFSLLFTAGRLQSPWFFSDVFLLLAVFLISALSKACLVWTAQKLSNQEPVTLKTAAAAGSRFVFTVLGLQLTIMATIVMVMAVLSIPILYLLVIGQVGRTIALAILGLAILVPASIFLYFMLIYSPVIAVLYKITARSALNLALSLTRTKMKESLVMAALLAGVWLGFIAVCGFGIIMLGAPVAFLSLVLAKLGLSWAIYLLILGAGFVAVCGLVILTSGVAVFNNFAWTLAVMEMVKTVKDGEAVKSLAPEVEPAS